jgi:phosphate ABC transporter phosphate-binding protein
MRSAPPDAAAGAPARSRLRRPTVAGPAAVVVVLLAALLPGALLGAAPPAAAADYPPVVGKGSTWSEVAIAQWVRNVKQYGMNVTYTGSGSSDGRSSFAIGTVDFGVSEIQYGLKENGVVEHPPRRRYAYMPIVAGGTAFMYNLTVGGRRVTNLRLSGATLTRIFTGQIKFWNDAAVKADNPGLAASLPARRVVPVVRSDGSGTTAQFSLWMSKRHPGLWDDYCRRAGRTTPCGMTSNYPVVAGSGFVSKALSTGVAGYVAETANVGTITYVEYAYALESDYPVVKVLNAKGYYVEPTAKSVAVGLLGARINTNAASSDYLTQILDGVYANPDARAYPLSSYSYMIVPVAEEQGFTRDKGRTLSAFAQYFLCQGQQPMEQLGYSPLPVNLVQAGFAQVRRIPGAQVQNIDIGRCNNPTLSPGGGNALAKSAPYPPACDRQGPTQCATGTGGATVPTNVGNRGGSAGGPGRGPGGGPGGGPGANGAGAPGGARPGSAPPGSRPAGAGGATAIDPDTGETIGGQAGGDESSVGVAADPVAISGGVGSGTQRALMALTALLLLLVVTAPPLLSGYLSRRRGR